MSLFAGLEHIIRENVPLASYTTLGIGGPARYFVEPSSQRELIAVVGECHRRGIPMRTLGGGSNLLVREGGVDGAVLSLSAPAFTSMGSDRQTVTCGSGAALSHFITFCVANELSGLEHLVGIPGSVGGALFGNAGTLNGDIGSLVTSVRMLCSDGSIVELSRDDIHFGTRRSSLDELAIVDATFQLKKGDATSLTKRMQTLWIVKRSSQPGQESRVITAFVDPDPGSASELLIQCGLAGYREGNCRLSPAFPNYLIADGPITSDDCLRLLKTAADRVEQKTGVQLQLHPQIW